MKNLLKNKLATALIIVATVILASVAIFTAMRLYQLRQSPVSPGVPESEPAASQTPTTNSCGNLAFSLSTPSLTPTGTVTVTMTTTPSVTPTSSLTPTASPSPTQPPRGGPSNTPTNTPTPTDSDVTSTPTSVLTVTPTDSDNLPEAGFGLPTTLALIFGSISLLTALSLAL